MSANRLARLHQLSPQKRAALEKLLRQQGITLPAAAADAHPDMQLAPVPRDRPLPLSFEQQRMWFLHQMEPNSPVLRLQIFAAFAAPAETLGLVIDELVARHEILRTTYCMNGNEPVQIVHAHSPAQLRVVDLSALSDVDAAQYFKALGPTERGAPMDLDAGPVWRAIVFRLSASRSALCMTIHHIASDGWSIDQLLQEVRLLCQARAGGETSALPDLPVQYADYAAWQRNWLQGEVLEREFSYWREQLAGMPRTLELATDKPRPAVMTTNGAAVHVHVGEDLAAGLRGLGQRQQATLFMTTLALFKVLLLRYTGLDDIVVGTPVAGRTRPEVARVQGLFLNTLVLRTRLDRNRPFTDTLATVRDTVLGAFSHQDLPFEKLVEALQPERDLSRSPLFQAFFTKPIVSVAPPGDIDSMGTVAKTEGQPEFDISLWIEEYERDIVLAFNYNADLFDRTTIERLAGHYLNLAAAAVADPGRRLTDLPLLGADEQAQLRAWNQTALPVPPEPVTRLFERQVQHNPQAPALDFGAQRLSYAELNGRANRLARHLHALGIGAGARVGILLERGIDMVVAVLGVLKAGAAYVPLDPAYPAERIGFMLEDSEAAALITSAAHAPGAFAGHIVDPERDAGLIGAQSDADLPEAPATADLAYMIYTSGSTGKPKGVQIEHRSLTNFLLSMAERPGIGPGDALLAVTTLSFDIAGLELYLPLVAGARIVLADRATAMDGRALAALVGSSGATLMQATPSTWRLLLDAGWAGDKSLRVLCGGEALPVELAARIAACCGELWNLYGPTETTIWSTLSRVAADARGVSIGRPIANTRIYVLDDRLQHAPIGVPGELWIGGAGVARGYWRRPELDAERFVADPFAETPGARMYRTGDRARFRDDGTIEYLGRLDNQVKLRGFRIELGEIETVLARAPGVRAAVAQVREDRPGDQRLVAYVLRESAAAPGADDLRALAARELPAFMVPSAWVFPESLPLTPNGKVDRKRLPAPEPPQQQAYAPPGSSLEQALAAIWCEVLQRERVGIHDGFFDLGGHSLLVVRVQARLRETTGLDVPVVDFFAYPTIHGLARHLGSRGETAPAAARAQAVPASDRRIAIVGMDGRFPGAQNLGQFWENLRAGVESIRFFTDEELATSGVDAALRRHPDYVPAKGLLDDAGLFDASFFGYSAGEAETIDPQQRLFLQTAWAALENAGYAAGAIEVPVGVFASASVNSYSLQAFRADGNIGPVFLNDKDYLATRVSYKLNLRGPSMTVQTACSSSLVAVAEACESLLAGRCDLAIAGGVSVGVPLMSGHFFQEGSVGSRDGHCRAFDAASSGCVSGNGVAAVVLKRYAEAVADGDAIRAVILAAAVNNDGSDKVGFTAPSVRGQAEVIAAAQAAAGIAASSISYVEAHGTGTAIGDPIEIAALTRAFGALPAATCAIGAVKTNIGHLDAAAGIAGLVKTVLCLEHGELVPSLNFDKPNPKIDFAAGPFYVNTRRSEWRTPDGTPRRAGVSSFGLGGTNAHVILEQAAATAAAATPDEPQLLVLSARSDRALDAATANLAAHLQVHPALALRDVTHTLQTGRKPLERRRVLVCRDRADAIAALTGGDALRLRDGAGPMGERRVAFLFSGQGAQYPGMARESYRHHPVFRAELDRCLELLQPHLADDLRELLHPQGPADAARLMQTANAQCALFAVEYALARLWMNWGMEPAALLGHSIGEYVAACLAGVFSLQDAAALVALRGRLMQAQPPGAMLAAPLAPDTLEPLADGLAIAAVNAPSMCVVSGPDDAIGALERRLEAAGTPGRRLHTSHAFHSPMMRPAAQALEAAMRGLKLQAPRLPYLSNVTGTWITPEQATDPAYWSRHLLGTVRFGDCVANLLGSGSWALLEVGPGNALCSLARQHPACPKDQPLIASLPAASQAVDETPVLLGALGQLWLAGIAPRWNALRAEQPARRVVLPSYPFEGQRYWIETQPVAMHRAGGPLQKDPEPGRWCYVPEWRSTTPRPGHALQAGERWLVLGGEHRVGSDLLQALRAAGIEVITAGADIDAILGSMPEPPRRLLLMPAANPGGEGAARRELELGFYRLLGAVQAHLARWPDAPLDVEALTDRAFAVTGDELVRPGQAALGGLLKVLPQEHPNIRCRQVDLDLAPGSAAPLIEALLGTLGEAPADAPVALRGRRRWVQEFVRAAIPDAAPRWREAGVYLITGGLGNVGLALAAVLARETRARLVLTARSALPERGDWDEWLARHVANDAVSRRIRAVRSLEALGAEVMVAAVDVADRGQLEALAAAVRARFGALAGVIHAAGVLGGDSIAPVRQLTPERCAQQFRAKIDGLALVTETFDSPDLDFFMPVSSLSAVLGGLGFGAYAAANAWMDAFSHAQHRAGRHYWISVDWDAWWFVAAPETGPGSLAALALSAEEGQQALAQLLSLGAAPQIVISTADLEARMARLRGAAAGPGAAGEPAAPAHERPRLAIAYTAPRNETEARIAAIWAELFKLQQVGIHDNFFELGGHSLLAIQAAARVRAAFHIELTLERFLELATVEKLAAHVEALCWASRPSGDAGERDEFEI